MEIKKLINTLIGKKHDYCEGCHRMAALNRVEVSSYTGKTSYKYLCETCERIEGFKKY